MSYLRFYCADYDSARRQFRDLAAQRGFQQEFYPLDSDHLRGPHGEELTVDVATRGAERPRRTLIVSSGLHGVEGYFGSAVQLAWLDALRTEPPAECRWVLVHGLNPYAFAWQRRWNENNVDLNRNFFRGEAETNDDHFHASQQVYGEWNRLLNPPHPPRRYEPFRLKVLLSLWQQSWKARMRLPPAERPSPVRVGQVLRLGLNELLGSLPVGQYKHPRGLFYGGANEEWSTRLVQKQIADWVGDSETIIHVDIHTGLFRFGDYKLLVEFSPNSQRYEWLSSFVDTERLNSNCGTTPYLARGTMTGYLQERLADRWYVGVTAEFGTYRPLQMLMALRAENQAHHHWRPGESGYRRVKQQLLDAFCPRSRPWRETTVRQGVSIIDQMVHGLCRPHSRRSLRESP
jgi:hypothetical protein